jgi:predicted transcriptional regulator
MPRPKTEHPTPAELEVLKILWDHGPATVREVLEHMSGGGRRRAYTSVMSLLGVMADKRLLSRERRGRAFVYAARIPRERTLGRMVSDLWRRAFDQSASSLVTHLLDEASPSDEELDAIRRAIESYQSESENP